MTLDSAGLATRATSEYDAFVQPQFTILNPCSKRWAELSGSGRVRFCETCQTPVHDFAQYSPQEWQKLREENNGRVCGHLPPPVEASRRRRAILVGALLTMASPLVAASGRVRLRVTDQSGAAVTNAEVSLFGSDGKPTMTMPVDAKGEVRFTNLPLGVNRFWLTAPGFPGAVSFVCIGRVREVRQDATLKLGNLGETIEIVPKCKPWYKFW